MPSQSHIKEIMQRYIDGFNKKDAKAVSFLFSDEARIEDPVGGARIIEGREAIDSFYNAAVSNVRELELVAPIRGSHSDAGAMAFIIHTLIDGREVEIHCIDVMTFNDVGKIVDMKAYWGQEDIK
ncbi:nuclear transport factor 2 family protein [Paenibacillus jamilae]|uniref:nuclear transport factor 2 family protein n=1 Tax=Paenibacillus jamilae TaxID=114136 RepID=UPI003D27A52F